MSGKLDQSLDEILSTTRRTSVGGRGRRNARRAAKPAHVAPSNGVKKTAKGGKVTTQRTPTGPSGTGESKIIVTGLVCNPEITFDVIELTIAQPKDVSEPMVKVCYR
jgi:THO complex subunit 4